MVTTDSQEAVPPFHEYETLVIRRYSVVVVKPEGTLYVADVAPAIVDQLGDVRLVFSCQIYANVELGIVVVPAVVDVNATGSSPEQIVCVPAITPAVGTAG